MFFTPELLGMSAIPKDELKEDRKKCVHVGPCGIGKMALYLNSFFIDRRYYVRYEDIDRIWKQVAMSEGGFTGHGNFASLPYLIVLLKNGKKFQCNFKFEDDVDLLLSEVHRVHKEIPIYSEEAEARLKKAEEEEQKLYLKELPPKAQASVDSLKKWQEVLKSRPAVYESLAAAAKQKRTIERISPAYRSVAVVIFLLSCASLAFGVYGFFRHWGPALYFVLFGIAFIFFTISTRILPTGQNNKAYAEREWQKALAASEEYVSGLEGFPVPAQYAHPVVLERMIRSIRKGQCETADEALALEKESLRKMDHTVTVSQKEYDEIVLVKPLFLAMNYQ